MISREREGGKEGGRADNTTASIANICTDSKARWESRGPLGGSSLWDAPRLCTGWLGGAHRDVWPCICAGSLRVCITCYCFADTISMKLISSYAPPFQRPPYLAQIYFVYTYNVFINVVLFAGMKCKLHFIHNANPPNPHKSDRSIFSLCSQTAFQSQKKEMGAQRACKNLGTFAESSGNFSASREHINAKAGSRVFSFLY